MPAFDLAWTREDLSWTKPNIGNHRLIVSQRFRQTIKKLGLRKVTYGIVRLVEKGWKPKPHGWEVTSAFENGAGQT